jgi:hypothetical protein
LSGIGEAPWEDSCCIEIRAVGPPASGERLSSHNDVSSMAMTPSHAISAPFARTLDASSVVI